MRKTFGAVLVLFLMFSFAACGAPAQESIQTTAASAAVSVSTSAAAASSVPDKTAGTAAENTAKTEPAPALVEFSDPVLESKVRKAINKPEGGITVTEAEAVTDLNVSNLHYPKDEWDKVPDSDKIHDISALAYFPNLVSLDIALNAIEDISVLASLTKLEKLEAPMNRIKDISAIAGLTSLRHAVFWNNEIADISPVQNLTELEVLSFFQNRVHDIGALGGLKKLTTLELRDNYIVDFRAILDILPNLTEKDFDAILPTDPIVFSDPVLEKRVRAAMNKPDGDITAAEALEVTVLSLGNEWQESIPADTQITDISSLKYFAKLGKLELFFHNITDISVLSYMPELFILDLNGNVDIHDISPLSNLSNMKMLNLSGLRCEDMSPLASLSRLEWLSISYTFVKDIGPLAGLTSLMALYMENVIVNDFTPISKLKKLTTLYIPSASDEKSAPDLSPLKDIYPQLTDKNFELK